jgi:hypothetical protein
VKKHNQLEYGSNKSDSGKNNNFKINNIPSYGLTNGFYVNKTADCTLVIEYQPQIWFSQGLIVSTLSLAAILVASILARKKFIIRLADIIKRKTTR